MSFLRQADSVDPEWEKFTSLVFAGVALSWTRYVIVWILVIHSVVLSKVVKCKVVAFRGHGGMNDHYFEP